MRIIGKRKVDFTDEANSRHIVGSTIWYAMEVDSVEGYQVEKAFISPEVMAYKEIPLDVEVDILFNYKGKISAIEVAII